MKKPFVNLLTFVFVNLFLLISTNAIADDLEKVRKAIKDKNANWTAEENWITRLTLEERKNLFGAIITPSDSELASLISLPPAATLPAVFDWRNNNGNWITPVKNQGNCGSCWDFSAVAQVEAWWKIYNNDLDSMIDLSEQFIISCGNTGSCDGGSCAGALEFVKNVGIPSEACFHYYANDMISCSNACSNWEDETVKIPGWGWITMDEAIIDNIKNAVFIHPVSVFLMVYTDLAFYSGGVYRHIYGQEEGGHMVLIVGWNDSEQSWICKNSWGKNWGDSGYFRIKWGECRIGTWSPFIWNDVAGGSAISVSPEQIDLSLFAGETIVQELTINNHGQNMLEYFTIDYGFPIFFHPDKFSAWDSLSWWCGDSIIGGYYNKCLQYLETPLLDLSNTVLPTLNWMGYWALEDPAGTFPPYDGWDGCNVWVSVDGGDNFDVAYPTNPVYDCNHLYSFSNPDGWNLGVVPGWGGNNRAWTPVEFDLTPYKSDSVIIRFAFASDEGYCTLDDPSLFGFFLDDIKISDGSTILFEDDANDITTMNRIGYGYFQTDWINIPNSVGQVFVHDSAIIDIEFDARNLIRGDYYGLIIISSNDTILTEVEIPIHIEVSDPVVNINVDDKIPTEYRLNQNFPNPFNPTTTVGFGIMENGNVRLSVLNILGEEIKVLLNEEKEAGYHSIDFHGSNLPSGVYFYRIQCGSFIDTKKMLLLK